MTNKDVIEIQGVDTARIIFRKLGFVFREEPVKDYGIDAIVELREENYLSGRLIAVQIKSGDSYFAKVKDNKVTYHGNIKHYNYWLNHSLPVIIVLYSPTKNECIWEVINKQTAIKCKKGWKISIPCNQILDNSLNQLQELAYNQSEYQRRWNSLVIAKEWMLETKKHGESILEVQEWINKTSGRGHFTLKVNDDDGEKVLFERELLGFGTKSYELVIQELFPWADIEIDEDFYDENIDEEFLKYYGNSQGIYPYKSSVGEVDFYRLRLTLNKVGKSFIEMEDFLETGNFYLIDRL